MTRISARPSVEYRKLFHILWHQWTSMVVFKTMKYYGVPPKVTGTVLIILFFLSMYYMRLIAVGIIYGGADVKKLNGQVAVISDSGEQNPKILNIQEFNENSNRALPKEQYDEMDKVQIGIDEEVAQQKKIIQTRKLLQAYDNKDGVDTYADNRQGSEHKQGQRQLPGRGQFMEMLHPDLNKDLNDPNKDLGIHFINQNVSDKVYYNKEKPFIWLMGMPSSGMSLLRVLLDSHPNVRCSERLWLMDVIFQGHLPFLDDNNPLNDRLTEANINRDVIHNALGGYIMTVMAATISADTKEPTHLCYNHPKLIEKYITDINKMFHNSKTILLIRDGRAVIGSMTRRVNMQWKNSIRVDSWENRLKKWNNDTANMVSVCEQLGPQKCRQVLYENVILHPQKELQSLFQWLEIPFDSKVLQHSQHIGLPGGPIISGDSIDSNKLKQPINMLSLYEWTKDFPDNLKHSVNSVAPMLLKLGYTTPDEHFPPDYGQPDKQVLHDTKSLEEKS